MVHGRSGSEGEREGGPGRMDRALAGVGVVGGKGDGKGYGCCVVWEVIDVGVVALDGSRWEGLDLISVPFNHGL